MEIGDLGNTEAVKSGGDARAFDAAAAGFQMRVLVVEIPDGQRQQREGGQQKDQQLFQTLFQDKSPPQMVCFCARRERRQGRHRGGLVSRAGHTPSRRQKPYLYRKPGTSLSAQGARRAGGRSLCSKVRLRPCGAHSVPSRRPTRKMALPFPLPYQPTEKDGPQPCPAFRAFCARPCAGGR